MKKTEKFLSDLIHLVNTFQIDFYDSLTSVERKVVELFSNIVYAAYLDVPSEELDNEKE